MMVMITPDFWFGGAGGGGGITYILGVGCSQFFRHVDCECALTLRAVAVRTLADGQGFVRE